MDRTANFEEVLAGMHVAALVFIWLLVILPGVLFATDSVWWALGSGLPLAAYLIWFDMFFWKQQKEWRREEGRAP